MKKPKGGKIFDSYFDLVQPKYDGRWVQIEVSGGRVQAVSRDGNLQPGLDIQINGTHSMTLLGEYLYGTQWARHSDKRGHIVLFDCLALDGRDLRKRPYLERHACLVALVGTVIQGKVAVAENYPASESQALWKQKVELEGFEGLIFRGSRDGYEALVGRCKKTVGSDYILMEVHEGQGANSGRMGAITVGWYVDGALESVMRVGGGFTDEQRTMIWKNRGRMVGMVVEVWGREQFTSGALRHPIFKEFRHDKLPRECVKPTGSRQKTLVS